MSDEVTTPPPAAPVAAPPATGPQPGAPAPEPVKSGKGKQIRNLILRIVAVPAVLIVGGIIWAFASGDPTMAKSGDCLIGQQADDIKIVGCDDATAEWKVVGKVEGVSEADYNATQDDTSCTSYTTATASFWSGKKGGSGDVLCLEPLKK
ncbi:hypothetical protein O7635_16685 [Asanoa sp. WMMD1127]|uniref:LppU/SCO3897 family protein n=1 Tax=Asanoa sp. WMMD1127 TaxID=3016107 RepID=UPI00241607AD|nr:hypothetical protein [Asanoa sp. WMMD1127]MDG4823496.1 hypothetical protein [Asanoa sp. WMMD1127]